MENLLVWGRFWGWFSVVSMIFVPQAQWSLLAAEPSFPPLGVRVSVPVQTSTTCSDAFARALYAQLAGVSGNVVVSPASVEACILLALAGADGQTAIQMAEALHLTPQQAANVGALLDQYQAARAGGPSTQSSSGLVIANSVWIQQGSVIHDAYRRLLEANGRASFAAVDFAARTEAARAAINAWVDSKTNHKIRELIPSGSLDSSSRLVLANAIYFKGKWEDPFNKRSTTRQPFHRPGRADVSCWLMRQNSKFSYLETDTYQAIELPYADSDLSMVVWLPNQAEGMSEMERELCREGFATSLAKFERTSVIVLLPKFKVDEPSSLVDALAALGMKDAFGNSADFSGIMAEPLCIAAIVHRALVEVDEEGTEAAAATGIAMAPTSMPSNPQEPKMFRADHPFMFAIRNRTTGQILFIGRVVTPNP